MEQVAHSILQHCHSSFVQSLTSSSLVISISQLLYAEECISERALDEIESPEISPDDKKASLLAAVYETVSVDYRKLNVLATVLSKFGKTKSIANSITSHWSKSLLIRSPLNNIHIHLICYNTNTVIIL